MAYHFELEDIQRTFDGQIVTLYGSVTRVELSSGGVDPTFDLSNGKHVVTVVMLDPLPVKVGMNVQVNNLIAIRQPHQPVHLFATSDSRVANVESAIPAMKFQPQADSKPSKCCDAPEDITCKRTGALHQAICFVCRRVIKEDQPYCSKQTGMVKCAPHVAGSLPPSPFKEDFTHACDADAPPPKMLKFMTDDDTEEEDPFQQPGHNVKF